MHTPLRLSGRHSLHTMHAAFIFHHTIDILARESETYLLISSGSSLIIISDRQLPPPAFGKFLIHPEKIPRKKRRLIASGAASNLHNRIFCILGIGRHKKHLDLHLNIRNHGGIALKLFTRHLPQFFVIFRGNHLFSLFNPRKKHFIFFSSIQDFLKIMIFFGEPHISFLIGNHRRIGYKRLDLFKSEIETVKSLQQRVICHVLIGILSNLNLRAIPGAVKQEHKITKNS